MRDRPLALRPDLDEVAAYVPPQQSARYRMNANESPYPPPPKLVDEVIDRIQSIALHRYSAHDPQFLDRLAERVAWSGDGLWIGNGSNEVLLQLFLAFGGHARTSMTFEPTYPVHSHISKITGTETVQVERADDLLIDRDVAVEAVRDKRPEIVIVCSPNNPSGGCEPLATVRALLAESTGLVVVDEAYGEFADPEYSARLLLDDYPNLVLLKTFSKAWRLAGVRVGYMLADPAVITDLERVRLPFSISSVTQMVATGALEHWQETLEIACAIAIERDRISVELQAMGVKTYPSDANFVLFEIDEADSVWKALLERDVLVRNYPGHPRLGGCLRVTAGLPEETDAFLGAMEQVLDDMSASE